MQRIRRITIFFGNGTRQNVRLIVQGVDSGRGQLWQGEWSREGADTIGHWHEKRRNARRETTSHT